MSDTPETTQVISYPCRLHDFGFFIGYNSVELSKEEAWQKYILNLFKDYRNSLDGYLRKSTGEVPDQAFLEEFDFFYKPRSFFLFGEFDQCVISLVEDFQFGSRTFRPFNLEYANFRVSEKEVYNYQTPFQRQVLLGPIPRFDDLNSVETIKSILHPTDKFPLIGICQIKLNNFVLLEEGTDYIRAVITQIHASFKLKKQKEAFEYLILESYTWNEVSLVIFSNSYAKIGELISDVYKLQIRDIVTKLPGLKKFEDLENEKKRDSKYSVYNEFNKKGISALDLSIVVDSKTTLGFDFDIFKSLSDDVDFLPSDKVRSLDLFNAISPSDEIFPIVKWHSKPGGFFSAVETLSKGEFTSDSTIYALVGKGNLIYPVPGKNINTKDFIRTIVGFKTDPSISKSIDWAYTSIAIPHQYSNIKPRQNDIVLFCERYENLLLDVNKNFLFSRTQVLEFRNNLKAQLVPKILREGVVNMISLYNNGIKDPTLFGYFLELYPFINYLMEESKEPSSKELIYKASKPSEGALPRYHKKLDQAIHAFLHAYNNRFQSSMSTGELNDYNIFFDGGIHQLVSAMDGLYKVLSSTYGNSSNFIFVEGDPEFSTSDIALRLNFFHLFQPEKLITIIYQEIANQIPGRYADKYEDLFKFLDYYNPNAEDVIDNVITESTFFDSASEEEVELVGYISPSFISHVFCDLFAFHFLYQGDFNLYHFWAWGYFVTNSQAYELDGEYFALEENRFINFLAREVCMYKHAFPQKTFDEIFDDLKFHKDGLNKLFEQHKKKVRLIVERIIGDSSLDTWFETVNRFLLGVFRSQFGLTIEGYKEKYGYIYNETVKCYERGEVVKFRDVDSKEERLVRLQILIRTHLEKVKQLIPGSSMEVEILPRNKKGGDIELNPQNSKLLFDPEGGIFVTDPYVRRRLYLYRSILHMSLCDLSLRNKKTYTFNFSK